MTEKTGKPVRIIMWCTPRSISSAFAKCLSGIEGMEIWFEPYLYAYIAREQYRKKYGEDGPMAYEGNEAKMGDAAEILESLAKSKIVPDRISFQNIKKRLEQTTSKYVFVKEIGYSVPDEKSRHYIPSGYKHVFLFRDPYRVIYSHRQGVYKHMSEAGVLQGDARDEKKYHCVKDDPLVNPGEIFSGLLDLYQYIKKSNIDPDPIVLNADDLLTNPAEVLAKFCEKTGLPYSDSLLHWDASTDTVKKWKAAGDSIILDVVTFYDTAMRSSEFLPPSKPRPRDEITSDVLEVAEAAIPFYNELNKLKMS